MPDQPTPRSLAAAFDAARVVLERHVDQGTLPCAVLGISDATGTLAIHAIPATRWPARPDSVWFLASVTKPIVATAVMQLVDEGRLDLDAPLRPDVPDRRGRVTARHVLSHTTGIPDLDLTAFIRRAPSFATLLRLVHGAEPVSDPGSRYAYASDSFMLLAEAIAARTGTRFARSLHERLLAPLGMVETGFDPGRWPGRVLPVADAPGQSRIGRRVVRRFLARATFAGGGLFATAEDLLRFGRSLLGAPGVPRVLSEAAIEVMARDQTHDLLETIDGLDVPAPGYALGWNRPRAGGSSGEVTLAGIPIPGVTEGVLTHAGVSGTRLWVDRTHGVVVVILSARWGVTQVPHAEAIAAIMGGWSRLARSGTPTSSPS